jgi:hypothetical protein
MERDPRVQTTNRVEQTCPYQTYYPAEPRNARHDPNATSVAARTPPHLERQFADFMALDALSPSSAAQTTHGSYTVMRPSRRDAVEWRP